MVICGRHGEVFKPRWPLGYPAFSILAFQALLERPEFSAAVKRLVDDEAITDVTAPMAGVQYLLATRPICCRLPPDTLLEVYGQVNKAENVWSARHCSICSRHRPGSAYRMPPTTRVLNPRIKDWKHVCLRCVTHGQR